MYNLFVNRMNEWMYSYNSLYGLFRQQFCHYFYIHYNNFFNIIFFYNKTNENNNEFIPYVLISNTHETFRNKLKKQNIQFITPLIENKNNENNNKENDIFDDDMDIEEL
eukprot:138235_1